MGNKLFEDRNSQNNEYVAAVTKFNVQHSMDEIVSRSSIIADLIREGKVIIAPGIYDVGTGKVIFSGF